MEYIDKVSSLSIEKQIEILEDFLEYPSWVSSIEKIEDFVDIKCRNVSEVEYHLERIADLVEREELDLNKDYIINYALHDSYDGIGIDCEYMSLSEGELESMLLDEFLVHEEELKSKLENTITFVR